MHIYLRQHNVIMIFLFTLKRRNTIHDDIIKWKHFRRYWSFVRGIGEFTGHRWIPLTKASDAGLAFMCSLICALTNGWINNREAGDLIRHRSHCDITVMITHFCSDVHRMWWYQHRILKYKDRMARYILHAYTTCNTSSESFLLLHFYVYAPLHFYEYLLEYQYPWDGSMLFTARNHLSIYALIFLHSFLYGYSMGNHIHSITGTVQNRHFLCNYTWRDAMTFDTDFRAGRK